MGEFPNNLIIVTSAPPRLQMRKRASDSNSTDSAMDPKLGLLHRYQVRPIDSMVRYGRISDICLPLLILLVLLDRPTRRSSRHGLAPDSHRLRCDWSPRRHRNS